MPITWRPQTILLTTLLAFTTVQDFTQNWVTCHPTLSSVNRHQKNLSNCPKLLDHYTLGTPSSRAALCWRWRKPLQISSALIRLNADQREGLDPAFDKKIVALTDLQTFIPNWLELRWSKVDQHPGAKLSIGRWQAQGDGWQLCVASAPVAQLSHREVMLRSMSAVGAV